MAELIVNERVRIPDDELRVAFVRSSGPGGQNVNKVSSKVELRWSPVDSRALTPLDRDYLLSKIGKTLTNEGELIIVSTLTRDQARNREDAEAKLVALLRAALTRPKVRRATKPSRGAKERRIAGKKHRGQIKRDRKFDD
ncbi:MAG TPA: alternative ribosome rescue aminoacyl-tRNA hydrolase ArfB [Kofleriaceae bacterium]|nr:alternative ribosome rescue aminoacyl-tRNA hydrolase ArfB [Kofleriaceae bacterium]